MRQVASAVTIVSTLDSRGRPWGVTVSSFGSLSLDPPLVQWSLRSDAFSCSIFSAARHFAVSILSSGQEELARSFCANIDRFAGRRHEPGLFGLPLFPGALAWIECECENGLAGGDHRLFVGRVLKVHASPGNPLLHWQGAYHRLAGPAGNHPQFARTGEGAGNGA